jgi:hypothetical protein
MTFITGNVRLNFLPDIEYHIELNHAELLG